VATEPVDYEIDIEVATHRGGEPLIDDEAKLDVILFFTDRLAGCEREPGTRPRAGTCEPVSPSLHRVPCGSWRCLHSIRVERDGNILRRQALSGKMTEKPPFLMLPIDSHPTHVVIEGCGQEVRVPIHGEPLAVPSVKVRQVRDAYEVTWTGANDASESLTRVGTWEGGGEACRKNGRGPLRIRARQAGDQHYYASIWAFANVTTIVSPFGRIEARRSASTSIPPASAPP
jgi:hypothetical protein